LPAPYGLEHRAGIIKVQAALEWVLEAGQVPEPDRIRELVRPATPVVPALAIPAVELASYDALLGELTR